VSKKPILDNVVPNDGTYLGTQKAKQLDEKKLKEKFDQAWKAQKELLKDCTVKLYKDKATLGLQWQSSIDYDDKPLIEAIRVVKGLGALDRGKFPHTASAVNNAIAMRNNGG
jgi:hypothetical protein